MRIRIIKIEPKKAKALGIQDINLSRLDTVVALVGKNGSGKSRILNLIEANISSIFSLGNIINENITNLPNSIKLELNKLEPYKEYASKVIELGELESLIKEKPNDLKLSNRLNSLKGEVFEIEQSLLPKSSHIQKVLVKQNVGNKQQIQLDNLAPKRIIYRLEELISELQCNLVKRINYNQIKQLQEVVSDNDEESNSFEQIIEIVTDQMVYNELGSIYKSSLRYLNKLPHQLVSDWMDSKGDIARFHKSKSYERFIAFKKIFEDIFTKTLDWEIVNVERKESDQGVHSLQIGVWRINQREFNYSEFSDGEKTLFAYVLMFFLMSQNSNISLKDSIIIIDEPELHLHPDAEIDLINGIRNIVEENGQLFIATHSINILSHLNYHEVFMVKDGIIKHPSKSIQREALSELMKIEERVMKLNEFLDSISNWAYIQFMMECFTNPEVIEVARENDPQIQSLKDIVKANRNNRKSLLLDIGAGKGRLYAQAFSDDKFEKIVDYAALEPNTDLHSYLKEKGISKIYSDYSKLADKSFDFVVLCNVLHEILIEEWVVTLNRIIDTLKDNGYLIIIEARILNKGEKIGTTGFLLLDEHEFKILFGLGELPDQLRYHDSNDNLCSVLLPKQNLRHLSNDDLLLTMKALEENTFNKLRRLRLSAGNDSSSNKYGRISAFLSQMHINSKLALLQLKEGEEATITAEV